ncbi:MAG: hypothetical protein JNJ58_13665 [Chitinophagaceae bacterium]|nr:hypothetical protein [Chitinophagaceae bacterium]
MKKPLFDDDEMYLNPEGLVVFTAEYLIKRGYCCGNGCLHCPYDYKNVMDIEKRNRLLNKRILQSNKQDAKGLTDGLD